MPALFVTGPFASALDKLSTRLRHRRAYAQLTALDDRMLTDIGLSRVEVEALRRM